MKKIFFLLLMINTYATSAAALDKDTQLLLDDAYQHLNNFNTNTRWDSVKNTIGSAKAVLLLPNGGQVGYMLGAQWGEGILLARRNQNWSQPVFVKVHSAMFGLLAGLQKVSAIGIMLRDDYAEQAQSASIQLGGTADLTIVKGVSGKVVGGTDGISTLMVSENSGLYFGGSMDAFAIRENSDLNQQLYGEQFDSSTTLQNFSLSENPTVRAIQNDLERIAIHAVFERWPVSQRQEFASQPMIRSTQRPFSTSSEASTY
ncbi:lipid-binding SYLF domain-containing protein [Vibrio fluvialis]|uniref:lipid-binding SYLF domain-containing protein n=1 Tax=Vibrio fluvialis TaxID=676 RepID=UPI0005C92C5C|nr:lipid-binding SYLF domain-containing protein [Vibrio fluvialis]EKO3484855.1 lipid-binding SYLF domain-containing protein [Vibrio fluvialis]